MSPPDPPSTDQTDNDKRRSIPVIPVDATKMPASPAWDIIPYEAVIWGPRLGKGAFGSVYKGTYLGLDIALKEVEPSTSYKVEKYFEREWRIMRECRHPNIVQFIGLCHEPEEDGRVFIVSEYVPRGNLRSFLCGRRDFPWRLRISFATDIARALAYLHARDCIHRDLKGENLLVTSNDRIKMTDFGFARITQNTTDQRNMTYCGTDWYMSPEMMNGQPFGLPTDVFSLGILFVEIASKHVVDETHFQISQDTLTLNPSEVYRCASPGHPIEFLELALDCTKADPAERPKMTEVLNRLRIIELDVLASVPESRDNTAEHVGSLKLIKNSRGRLMPDFYPNRPRPLSRAPTPPPALDQETAEAEEEEEAIRRQEQDALAALSRINIDGSGPTALSEISDTSDVIIWRTATWSESKMYRDSDFSSSSESSFGHKDRLLHEHTPDSRMHASALRQIHDEASSQSSAGTDLPLLAVQNASALDNATPIVVSTNPSVMTIRPPPPATPETLGVPATDPVPVTEPPAASQSTTSPEQDPQDEPTHEGHGDDTDMKEAGLEEAATLPDPPVKLKTRYSLEREREQEDEAAGLADRVLGTHRFTVITKALDSKRPSGLTSALSFAFWSKPQGSAASSAAAKCKVCSKKLGLRPSLQCDDCGTVVHATCSHSTPRDCHLVEQPGE